MASKLFNGLILLLCLGFSSLSFGAGVDESINGSILPLAQRLSYFVFYKVDLGGVHLPIVVAWLVLGSIFCTIYFGFVNFRHFGLALRVIRGDYTDPNEPGEVSHFQALTAALSGTIGIGNIGAVAVAVTVGGAGATLWMILAGFLGMSLKFAECTLAVMYRRRNQDGSFSGGPMYYLADGPGAFPRLRRGFGGLYAFGIIIGSFAIGNMFQSNQAFVQVVEATGGAGASWFADKGWLVGLIVSVFVGLVIIGGIKSIGRVTEKLVPMMAILYLAFALGTILFNWQAIPGAIAAIFVEAFNPQAVTGGILGGIIVGVQRAVFSNEAGLGSAAIAHSAVKTNNPATEGLVAMLGPFIDTVVICTITALVIGTTHVAAPGYLDSLGITGVAMTSAAISRNLGWAPLPLMIVAAMFAFSTIISWAYYGLKGWSYLVGEGQGQEKIFKLIYCSFVIIGAASSLETVLLIGDSFAFIICVPNIFAILVMAPKVKEQLATYIERVRSGQIPNYRKLEKLGRKPIEALN